MDLFILEQKGKQGGFGQACEGQGLLLLEGRPTGESARQRAAPLCIRETYGGQEPLQCPDPGSTVRMGRLALQLVTSLHEVFKAT